MPSFVEVFLPLFVAINVLSVLPLVIAPMLIAWMGTSAAKAIGKGASLFLSAISVALIRTDVAGILTAFGG